MQKIYFTPSIIVNRQLVGQFLPIFTGFHFTPVAKGEGDMGECPPLGMKKL